jgi:hypothetical protein
MAVTAHVYPNIIHQLGLKAVSLTADSFSAGLCTGNSATWAATQWAYLYASDMTTNYTEVTTGGGYTSGYANRLALATLVYVLGSANNIYNWSCTSPAPISFGASTTITARTMFIYDKTANGASSDANSWVPWSTDFGLSVTSTAGAFTYTQDAVNALAYWTMS